MTERLAISGTPQAPTSSTAVQASEPLLPKLDFRRASRTGPEDLVAVHRGARGPLLSNHLPAAGRELIVSSDETGFRCSLVRPVYCSCSWYTRSPARRNDRRRKPCLRALEDKKPRILCRCHPVSCSSSSSVTPCRRTRKA